MQKVVLAEHLKDLRNSFIKMAITLVLGFILCYSFGKEISNFLLWPLRNALLTGDQIVFTGVLDKVTSYFQISFWSSIIISSPIWTYFVWSFIRPALHVKEAKLIRPFIILSFLLFLAGILFGYYIVFPGTIDMLLNFGVTNVKAMPNLKEYLVLSVKVLVFLGFIFQFPMIIFILGLLGIVTSSFLKTGRPYIYLGLAVLSAFFTPPDVFTMFCLWLPLVILFELGVMSVWLKGKFLSK